MSSEYSLVLTVKYNMGNGTFDIGGNVKEEKRRGFISDFLREQMGEQAKMSVKQLIEGFIVLN